MEEINNLFLLNEKEDKMWNEYAKEIKKLAIKQKKLNSEYRKKLKGQINVNGLYYWLNNTQDNWMPEDIVEIELTNEKQNGYPNQCCRIVGDNEKLLYIKRNFNEVKNINDCYVWQTTTSLEGDSYFGYLLFELKNDKFFKVSYNC